MLVLRTRHRHIAGIYWIRFIGESVNGMMLEPISLKCMIVSYDRGILLPDVVSFVRVTNSMSFLAV